MSEVESIIVAPSEENLEKCTKELLVTLAEHYGISLGDKRLKENVKVTLKTKLVQMGDMAID